MKNVDRVQNFISSDTRSGEEAVGSNLKVYDTLQGNCHTVGMPIILEIILAPTAESSNKYPEVLEKINDSDQYMWSQLR